MKILICNNGCDDTTYTELEVNKEELNTLVRFAKKNNENSSYGCMPKIEIYTEYKFEDGFYHFKKALVKEK